MDRVKPLSLAVALGLALDISGAMHVYGLADATGQTRESVMATILIAIALLWLLIRPGATDEAAVPPWLAFLPLTAALLSMSDVFSFVTPGWSTERVIMFGGGTIVLLALAARRAPGAAIAGVAFALGVGLRGIHMRHIPIEPARGDMLPLVMQALDRFGHGQSPYTTYHMPWELPLTYLPLTWLAYAPATLLRLDIRWTNVAAEVALLGALLVVARRHPTNPRQATDISLLLWAWTFLSPTIIHWDTTTSAPIGWAVIAWTLALVVIDRPQPAAIVLGLAVATTPLRVVAIPLVALCWWRHDGLGATIRRGVVAGAVAAVVMLPFAAWTPGPFLDGTVRWFNDLQRFPRAKWESEHTWAVITGYSGLFWERGWENWLKLIQLVLLGLVTILYAARGAGRADLLRYTTAAFLFFVLFNPVLWPYLYNPALVAALLAVAGQGVAETARVAANQPLNQAR